MNELHQILPEQFQSNSPYVTGDEEDEYKEIHQNFTTAFPDAKPTIDVILSSGDLVAVLTSWNATHQNEFHGFPPAGKNIQWKEADVYRMFDGKILEHWNVADGTNLYFGIGLLTVANSTAIK